jgi:methyl-accepting chemotaxis protein
MPTILRRLFGGFLILLALAGLIATIYSLQGITQLKNALIPKIEAGFEVADQTLDLTTQALDVIEKTLQTTSLNVTSMRAALLTLAQSVHDTSPILESLSTVTGETLPDTITATQTSLVTAQTTAKTIEDLLRLITSIPLMPGDPYNPRVPLYTALGQISNNLNEINPKLLEMKQNLGEAETNLTDLEGDILKIDQDLLQINENLSASIEITRQYRELTQDLQTRLDTLKSQVPGWIAAGTAFLIFILAWVAVYQVDLLIRGYRLIRLKI